MDWRESGVREMAHATAERFGITLPDNWFGQAFPVGLPNGTPWGAPFEDGVVNALAGFLEGLA